MSGSCTGGQADYGHNVPPCCGLALEGQLWVLLRQSLQPGHPDFCAWSAAQQGAGMGKAERSSRAVAAYLFHVQGHPRPLSHLLPVTSFFLERDKEKGNESITMVYCRVLPFSTLNRTEKLRSRTLRSCQVCTKGRKE